MPLEGGERNGGGNIMLPSVSRISNAAKILAMLSSTSKLTAFAEGIKYPMNGSASGCDYQAPLLHCLLQAHETVETSDDNSQEHQIIELR